MSWSPWKFGTADGWTQQTLVTALGMLFTASGRGWLLCRIYRWQRVSHLQSGQQSWQGEDQDMRAHGACKDSEILPPSSSKFILEFSYYSVPFISLIGTLSRRNLHCCCSSGSSSPRGTALCKLQHPTASKNSHEPPVVYTQYCATQKAFCHLYLNLPLTNSFLNFQTCKYRKRGR